MNSKLSSEDLKKLDLLWQKFRQIESLWNQELSAKGLPPSKSTSAPSYFLTDEILAEIHQLFENLRSSLAEPSFELKKCLEIEKHLRKDLELPQFLAFVLPIERLLQKNLADDDFLVSTLDQTQKTIQKIPLILVLDHLRSSFNVGSILRTAECFGAEEVMLIGYTPTPENSKTQKAAMGVENFITWSHRPHLEEALQELKNRKIHLVALETSQKAKSLYAPFEKKPTALIFGNERFGLGPECLRLCDEIRQIPLTGMKNSLNVGSTAAIALSEWKRQYEL